MDEETGQPQTNKDQLEGDKRDKEEGNKYNTDNQENIKRKHNKKIENILGKQETKKKEYFHLKASLFGLWIPSVVGRQNNVFVISAFTSLVTRILI